MDDPTPQEIEAARTRFRQVRAEGERLATVATATAIRRRLDPEGKDERVAEAVDEAITEVWALREIDTAESGWDPDS